MNLKSPEKKSDRAYRLATAALAASLPFFIFAILIFIFQYSIPAIKFNGSNFLRGITWNPGNENSGTFTIINGIHGLKGATFGVLVFLVGTLLSSGIALLLAVPASIAIAVFLSNDVPRSLSTPLVSLVDLLAGVPSVVYGLWGIVVLVPLMQRGIAPAMISTVGFIPFLGGPAGAGYGLLTSGLVLALMVTPIISSTVRESFNRTPSELKDGAFAVGCTKWEVITKIVIPYSKTTIVGASLLGLGRALGETMAILMVGGGALNYLPRNIYSPISTMATAIVSLLDSAFTDPTQLALYSLAEIALLLFAVTLAANMIARLYVSGGITRAILSRGPTDEYK